LGTPAPKIVPADASEYPLSPPNTSAINGAAS